MSIDRTRPEHKPAPHADPGPGVNGAPHNPTTYAAKLDRAVSAVAPQLRHLIDADQVVELRVLRVRDGAPGGSTWAGTFRGDELELMARAALQLSGDCQGVYYTLNPLSADHWLNQAPRVQRVGRGQLAEDKDVVRRRRLPIDVDPVKAEGHRNDPATDGEKARALDLVRRVREYLTAEGWPEPKLVKDSGNGGYLEYLIDLPAADDGLIRRVLRHLAATFDGPDGTIDTSVYNPARITRVPGTLNGKGEPTADRPHRRVRLLKVAEAPGVVTAEQLRAMAARAPEEPKPAPPAPAPRGPRPSDGELDRRVRAYMAKVSPAISGQRGHHQTIRAAAYLIRGFGMTPAEAFPYLAEWNERCDPPWSEAELRRKLFEATKHPGPRGFLLDRDPPPSARPEQPAQLRDCPGTSNSSDQPSELLDVPGQSRSCAGCKGGDSHADRSHECSNQYRTPWLAGWGSCDGDEGRVWVRCKVCPGCVRWKLANAREELVYGVGVHDGPTVAWTGHREDWAAVRKRILRLATRTRVVARKDGTERVVKSAPCKTVRNPDGTLTAVVLAEASAADVPGVRVVSADEAVHLYDQAEVALPDPLPDGHKPTTRTSDWPAPEPAAKKGGYRVAEIGPALLDDEIEAVARDMGIPVEKDGLAGSGGIVRSTLYRLRNVSPDKAAAFRDRIRRPPEIVTPPPGGGAWWLDKPLFDDLCHDPRGGGAV